MQNIDDETIVAQATPPGRGGVAIVRVSGARVKNIITDLLKCTLTPRHATYLPFKNKHDVILDQGIAIFFAAPHSFTGEDILELHCHGGPIIVDFLLQEIISLGARLARPGEFSERAFLNNKIDLTQAEAIADLINASSKEAAQSAMRSLQGDFSREITLLNDHIIHLRMYVEAAIDFTDEEINFLSEEKITAALHNILMQLRDIKNKAIQGNFLREGLHIVIIGAPNVGKSSLLNALSEKEIAIVTPIPGTTRDVLRNELLIDGIPIHVIDTAGFRESDDLVEQEGMKRAVHEINHADIILCMMQGNKHDLSQEIGDIKKLFPQINELLSTKPILIIRNKIDLLHESPSVKKINHYNVISLSTKIKSGIELLKQHIKNIIGFQSSEGVYLARRRHLDALAETEKYICASMEHKEILTHAELVAEELRLAQSELNKITGAFSNDDLLGKIFSNFCIGK